MFNDIGWARKATKKVVNAILQVLPNRPNIFLKDIGHASDLDLKQNGVLHSLKNQTVRGTESLDAYIWRKQTPFFFQRNECFGPRTSEKQRRRKDIDTLQRGTGDCRAITTHHCLRESAQCLRSCSGLVPIFCSANRVPKVMDDSFCKISMISTRILRQGGYLREDDGANEWERCFHVSWGTRNPMQMWIITQRLKTHQRTFRISPNPRSEARGNSVRQREQQFENLPGDLHLNKLTLRIFANLEMIKDPNRKDLFEATPEVVWHRKTKVQNILTVMELKSRLTLRKKTEPNPGSLLTGVLKST